MAQRSSVYLSGSHGSCMRLQTQTSTGEAMVPTPPPSPGTGVPRFKPMSKVKLLVRLGGLRMHNNPNNNSRQKDLIAAGQLAPAWQTMRNAVQKQMMAAALGQKSRAAKDNFNVRRRPMLTRTSRSLPTVRTVYACESPACCTLLRHRAACLRDPMHCSRRVPCGAPQAAAATMR